MLVTALNPHTSATKRREDCKAGTQRKPHIFKEAALQAGKLVNERDFAKCRSKKDV